MQSEAFHIAAVGQTQPVDSGSREWKYLTTQRVTVPSCRMLPFLLLTAFQTLMLSSFQARWTSPKVVTFALWVLESRKGLASYLKHAQLHLSCCITSAMLCYVMYIRWQFYIKKKQHTLTLPCKWRTYRKQQGDNYPSSHCLCINVLLNIITFLRFLLLSTSASQLVAVNLCINWPTCFYIYICCFVTAHSVTCYPARVNTPRLNSSETD